MSETISDEELLKQERRITLLNIAIECFNDVDYISTDRVIEMAGELEAWVLA